MGSHLLQFEEEYHASKWWSVTYFTEAEHIYGQPRLRKGQFRSSSAVACSHLSGLDRP